MSPTCLACPLIRCKYESEAAWVDHARYLGERRQSDALRLLHQGLSFHEIADRQNVSVRTLDRIVTEALPPMVGTFPGAEG